MNRYFSQRKFWMVCIGGGLIVFLVMGLVLFRENATALAGNEATATAMKRGPLETWWAMMAKMAPEKVTAVARHNATLQALHPNPPTWTPFDKVATAEKMLTSPPTKAPPSYVLFLQRPAGAGRLIGGMWGVCGNQCYIRNAWVEKTKDKFIVVYAARGAWRDPDPPQAQVVIAWLSLSDQKPIPGGGIFPAPIPAQSIVIVDAVGEQLVLRTNDGNTLAFDVPSQQFISAPQLTTLPQRQADAGIVTEDSDVPFSRPGFRAIDRWFGKNGNDQVTVFAGVEGQGAKDLDLGPGVLVVVASRGQGGDDTPMVYYPPEPAESALRVFDVKGNLVALVSWGGGEFFFDLSTRQFVPLWDAKAKAFLHAPLFDSSMPIADATPQPVIPLVITPSIQP